MLLDFRCKDTQALFAGYRVARFAHIEAAAMRKLQQLHAATDLSFLRVPPGNRLELLKGNRVGQHSIRINDQWRLCFIWTGADASQVEIVDYPEPKFLNCASWPHKFPSFIPERFCSRTGSNRWA